MIVYIFFLTFVDLLRSRKCNGHGRSMKNVIGRNLIQQVSKVSLIYKYLTYCFYFSLFF